jgi:hypothetical protein
MRFVIGTVSSLDGQKVKVALTDKDKTVTAALQVLRPVGGSAGGSMPQVDDIVMCIYLDNGTGYVIGQIID